MCFSEIHGLKHGLSMHMHMNMHIHMHMQIHILMHMYMHMHIHIHMHMHMYMHMHSCAHAYTLFVCKCPWPRMSSKTDKCCWAWLRNLVLALVMEPSFGTGLGLE